VIFLDAAFFAALTPLLPDFQRELGISEASAGVLSGVYAAGTLIFALPAGWLCARFGPRFAVVLGLFGIGFFSPIFGFANELLVLDVSRFFQGASGALLWAGAMSWVVIAGPEERRGALVGTLIAAATVGELLGSPIGALAHEIGREGVFGAVAIVALALLALTLTNKAVKPADPQSIGYAWRAARTSDLGSAMWLLAAPSFAFGVVVVAGPLRLDELGGTAVLIAAAFASGSVVETLLGPVIGRVSDKVGRTLPYRFGLLAGAAGILGVCALGSISLVFAAVVLCAFSAGLAFAPSIALIADSAADAGISQGYASGTSNAAWGGGQMLGAFGGGALAGIAFIIPAVVTVGVLALAGVTAKRLAGLESETA
jgi:DHA1 family multidrug resistance protein-like MFS transporter